MRSSRRRSNRVSSQAISPTWRTFASGAATGLVSVIFSAFLEHSAAFVRHFQHAEFFRRLPEKAKPDQFTPDGRPFQTVMFPANAVGRKSFISPFADFFRGRAGENLHDMVQADAKTVLFVDAVDTGEQFLRGQRAVKRGARGKAIVAGAAASSGKLFTEIGEQFTAPAIRTLGIVNHPLQLFAGNLLFLGIRFFINEHRLLHCVTGAEKQDTFPRQTVTTRTAGFLIIALDVLRQVVMDNETDIWLVDAMPKAMVAQTTRMSSRKKSS